MRRLGLVAAAAVVALGSWACDAEAPRSSPLTSTTTTAPTPVPTDPRPKEDPPRPGRGPAPAECTPDSSLSEAAGPVPADLAASLGARLADPALVDASASASVWIEGWGEVAALNPELELLPASNEKIVTGMGALAVLGPDVTLETAVVVDGAVEGTTLRGNLVVVGGGDPTLATGGPHSLDTLAAQVRTAGVTQVTGALVVDESRHDTERYAPGWQWWHIPTYAGPLSAFMVDRNLYRDDPDYVEDPALGNGEELRGALARQGVTVVGPTVAGPAPRRAARLAVEASPPVSALVYDMLLRSDNMTSEQLVREIGLAGRGKGSTPAGTRAATDALGALCVPLAGTAADGSGLSRENFRSAREWRTMLQAARTQPWFSLFYESLPVGGVSGTLARRFGGTAAAGNVRAKTGSIIGGVALSGYVTTAGGRDAIFSVVVNGPSAAAATGVIDEIVATVAAYPG